VEQERRRVHDFIRRGMGQGVRLMNRPNALSRHVFDAVNGPTTDAGPAPMQRGANPNALALVGSQPQVAPAQPSAGAPNALASAWQMPQRKDSIVRGALDAFQKSFDPRGRDARVQQETAAGDQKKQAMLSMVMEQRAQAPEQRLQWFQQNAPLIEQATGMQVAGRPLDPAMFTDQALDAQIAALGGQKPKPPEGFTLAPGAQRYEGGQMVAENPASDKAAGVDLKVGGNGNYWEFDKQTREWRDSGVLAEQGSEAGGGFTLGKDQTRFDASGNPIARGPSDPAPGPNAPLSPEAIRLEREYAKDWKNVDQNFKEIDSQFKRMETVANRKDAAGDLALIISFTKMLDPGSVAREGEVKLTQSAASLVDQALIWTDRIQKGNTLLPDSLRAAYLDAARDMYGVYQNAYQGIAQDYARTAQDYGFNPDRVMMGYDAPAQDGPDVDLESMMSQVPAFIRNLFNGGGDGGQAAQPAPQQRPAPRAASPASAPPDIAPEVWEEMTPEQRALWDQ
jgi:hypothetical protein